MTERQPQSVPSLNETIVFQHDVGAFNMAPEMVKPFVEQAAKVQALKPYDRRIVTLQHAIPTPERTVSILVLERIDQRQAVVDKFAGLLQELVNAYNDKNASDDDFYDACKAVAEKAENALAEETIAQMMEDMLPELEAEDGTEAGDSSRGA